MDKNLHPILKSMLPIVEGISKTFGKNCEVVLHELKNSKKSIVAIYNGHVTGRSIGSTMLDVGIEAIRKGNDADNILNYRNKSSDGRVLKSSTMFIRDENDEIIGCICINNDISEFVVAQKSLEEYLKTETKEEVSLGDVPNNNVNDVLINIVSETLENFGKPVSYMNKEEKVNIVKRLDEQGAFLIKGAIDYVAKILCVSRYTIYNYLDEIRVNG
ncbi:Predicted transcriptional regulator YheO, contains PAS and DNA-binding HTH domains [Natronincola peptidivorans]|uniref:Predicted transcriptional regulator YheO, contains PAS and DNA-binding HTH domains n=1 Tax=Natronincola peptidivorans TaxID=426128 RepID=A0A1H9YYH4_9FIRM|nr:PAS domain-containing protein [Natronincola peptidivorans]SES74269.1 Predicted transcriptional regulator YheO, contains PAS and DNA-binding HTH domains [Natronincola peptidivorans]